MAKKNAKQAQELKEVSRTEINGVTIITFEDGSVKIIPAPICLTAEQAQELFGSSEEDEDEDEEEEDDSDDEDEDDSDEDEEDDSEDDDDSDEDEEDDDEDSDDEDEDDEEDEEEDEPLTPEALAAMDFEELEDLCDDKDLDTDPDDYDEKDVEKLRSAVAKELGIKLPKKAAPAPAKKKGKK